MTSPLCLLQLCNDGISCLNSLIFFNWQASSIVEEEIQYLRVAMGHENESFEDFVKAHDACQEDLMFFPTNNSYGLASVAGNADKISALQNEFETVKKRMDDEAKKASRLEQKIKLLTQGYQVNLAWYIIYNQDHLY